MQALFECTVWLEFYRDEHFWNMVFVISVFLSFVVVLLFSDHLKRWMLERGERAGWNHWNGPGNGP